MCLAAQSAAWIASFQPMPSQSVSSLFVIIKIAERCNLNCSYCYYYADSNSEVYARPTRMSPELLGSVVEFLASSLRQVSIDHLVFVFHGGEPTLARSEPIRDFCRQARAALGPRVRPLRFALQTNGLRIPPAWQKLVFEEQIHVGVSIDGDRETHDAMRVDHRGRGSYDRIRASVAHLRQLADGPGLPPIGVIAVMGDSFRGLETYRHLVDSLGFEHLKFLFPDASRDTVELDRLAQLRLAGQLCEIFDHWLVHDQTRVEVELFDEAVRRNLAARVIPDAPARPSLGLSVLSDGSVRISDDYMAATDWFASQAPFSVERGTLEDWLSQPRVRQILDASASVPTGCRSCRHARACGGGEVAHRYSSDRGFDNPSAYCTVLTLLHDHIHARLEEGLVEADRALSIRPLELRSPA